MSIIRDARIRAGLSQAAVAKRAGVSPAAVAQWESSDDAGTIQMKTVRRAMSAMGLDVVSYTIPQDTIKPVVGAIRAVNIPVQDARKTVLDAVYGNRIPTVVGEAWTLGIELSIEQLWVVADFVSVAAPLTVWDQARAVRDSYMALMASIQSHRFVPQLRTLDGRIIPVPTTWTISSVIEWAATSIRNGGDWLTAYRQAGALLIQQGLPWPVLSLTDQFKNDWAAAVKTLAMTGNITAWSGLLLDAMEDNDG